MTAQSLQRGWLGAKIKAKAKPLIDKALGRKVLKRPSQQQLSKLQSKFAKGPK